MTRNDVAPRGRGLRRTFEWFFALAFAGALIPMLVSLRLDLKEFWRRARVEVAMISSISPGDRARNTVEGISVVYNGQDVDASGILRAAAPLEAVARRAPPLGMHVVLVSGKGDHPTLWGSIALQYHWSPNVWVTPMPFDRLMLDPRIPTSMAFRQEMVALLGGAEIYLFHQIEPGGIDRIRAALKLILGTEAFELLPGSDDRCAVGLLTSLTKRIRRGDADVQYLRELLP